MKSIKLILTLLLLGAAGIGNAWADRGHHSHFGVVIGAPFWGPSYYSPYPYYPPYSPYYYPPVVVERPAAPQVYIEQQPVVAAPPAPAAAAAPVNYWYYCAAANGYYPYVKECRGGWQRVLPQPPGQP